MGAQRMESGFTVIEMVVTLVVLSLFMLLFYQLFMSADSQRLLVIRRAAANDIAQTNIDKITSKSSVTLPSCVAGAGSPNSLTDNVNAAGSVIATNDTSDATNYPSRSWPNAGLGNPESISGTTLPTSTVQKMIVIYPRGCTVGMPAKIISTVIYGTDSASHAVYVN